MFTCHGNIISDITAVHKKRYNSSLMFERGFKIIVPLYRTVCFPLEGNGRWHFFRHATVTLSAIWFLGHGGKTLKLASDNRSFKILTDFEIRLHRTQTSLIFFSLI